MLPVEDDEVGEDEEVMEEGSVVSTVGAGGRGFLLL